MYILGGTLFFCKTYLWTIRFTRDIGYFLFLWVKFSTTNLPLKQLSWPFYQGWGAGAGCFWLLGAGAGAAWKKTRSRSRSRSRLKKNQEPEPLGKKNQEPEPEKNLPAPQPCLLCIPRVECEMCIIELEKTCLCRLMETLAHTYTRTHLKLDKQIDSVCSKVQFSLLLL